MRTLGSGVVQAVSTTSRNVRVTRTDAVSQAVLVSDMANGEKLKGRLRPQQQSFMNNIEQHMSNLALQILSLGEH